MMLDFIKKNGLVFLLFAPIALMAQGQESLGVTTYYFSDSGGNSVSTTSFNLAKKVFGRTVLLFDLELDNVTVPPVTASTGATRPSRESSKEFQKTRSQAIVGIEQGLDAYTSLMISGYRSHEQDYQSTSLIGSLSRELNEQNTTVTVRGQYIGDQVGEILADGTVFYRDKTTYWGAVNISQLMSPTVVLNFSYDGIYYDGFLSDPYRQVRVFDETNDFEASPEMHPDTRLRQALTAKFSKAIPDIEASFFSTYRYYWDDWEVASHTADLQFNKYVNPEVIVRMDYRYYTQGDAYFWQERYRGEQFSETGTSLRTADYKLRSFSSNNFGL